MRNYHDDANSGETEVSMTVYIPIPPPPSPCSPGDIHLQFDPGPPEPPCERFTPNRCNGRGESPLQAPPPRIHRLYHRERALGSEQSRAVDPRVAGALERYLGGGAVGEARYGLEACSRLGIARVRVMTPGDEGAAG